MPGQGWSWCEAALTWSWPRRQFVIAPRAAPCPAPQLLCRRAEVGAIHHQPPLGSPLPCSIAASPCPHTTQRLCSFQCKSEQQERKNHLHPTPSSSGNGTHRHRHSLGLLQFSFGKTQGQGAGVAQLLPCPFLCGDRTLQGQGWGSCPNYLRKQGRSVSSEPKAVPASTGDAHRPRAAGVSVCTAPGTGTNSTERVCSHPAAQ